MLRFGAAAAAAALFLALAWEPGRPALASHTTPSCAFDIDTDANTFTPMQTYEAADWPDRYLRALELAGTNQLLPELADFSLPPLETGPRGSGSSATVTSYIPPTLLKAIGWMESSLWQGDHSVPYGGVGPALISFDCGYGIMQVTSGMGNTTGVPSLTQAMIGGHYAFNIARGARILADKWNMAPEFRPLVGERDPRVVEDWYYALWGYNGFAFVNHPLNARFDPLRPPYSCNPSDGFGHDRSRYPYQELILGCAAHPPQLGVNVLWSPLAVHTPSVLDPAFAGPLSLANWDACAVNLQCAAMDIPRPNPWNSDPTTPAWSREQVMGGPAVSVSTGAITLVASPGGPTQAASIDISNPGSGVLAWRLSASTPWLKVSRVQGVSLGADTGPRSTTITIHADASALPPGTYGGRVTVESLYAAGAGTSIDVTLRVLDLSDGTLIKGTSPHVYVARGGLKRWVPSAVTFEASGFAWGEVNVVPDSWIQAIPSGQPVPDVLADGGLIKASDATVYVMQGGARRGITGTDVFAACGYGWDAVRVISDGALASVPSGPLLSSPPCPRPSYEDGGLLLGSGPAAYVMVEGTKHWIINPVVFEQCGNKWGNLNRIADSSLNEIPEGAPVIVCFLEDTLLRGSGPAVYIVKGGLKRWVPNPATLEYSGFTWANVNIVPDDWIQAIPTGQPLLDALADGGLLLGPDDTVYVMQGAAKRPVAGTDVFAACGYGWDAVRAVSDGELGAIPTGALLSAPPCPLRSFDGGTLLQGPGPAVYVVADGTRRWIASPAVLLDCGYRWGNINRIAQSTLDRLPEGPSFWAAPCR